MATKNRTDASLVSTLLAADIYKRNQGRLSRQLTVLALWAIIFMGCYVLSMGPLGDYRSPWIRIGIPTAIAVVGAWVAYRVVNYPRFADFLVSVEAEMAKVSWPGRDELWRATIVVIVTMLLLAIVLFGFDYIWQFFFRLIGVIHAGGAAAPPPAGG
jgi:preprotein translocase subunit SecE